MSARFPSKRSRTWDRGSHRDRRRDRGSPIRNDRIGRRELQSPTRRWDSAPRSHSSGLDSAGRSQRKGFGSPRTIRRNGSEDELRAAHGQHFRGEQDNRLQTDRRGDDRRDGQGPAGLVFLCTNLTKRDCFQYCVFGLPSAQREIVEGVSPGTKLFLLNLDTNELFGIFEAVSSGGLNLVPEAFQEFKGSYAAQVRFRIYRECFPLVGEIVRDALKDNFSLSSKFDCELSADQVRKLMQCFLQSELQSQNPAQRTSFLWDRERRGQESRLMNASMGANAPPFDQNGGQLISVAQPAYLYEKSDVNLPSSMNFSEAPHLMNKGVVGSQISGENAYPNPAAVLGQGLIEEVDQLALKYLQNHPGYLGIRLEPLDIMSNKGYSRDYPPTGPSHPQMNYIRREDGGNYPDTSIQPTSSMQFGPGMSGVNLQQEKGLQPHFHDVHFPGGSFNVIPEFPQRSHTSFNDSGNMQPTLFRESGGMSDPVGSFDIGSLPPGGRKAVPLPIGVGTVSAASGYARNPLVLNSDVSSMAAACSSRKDNAYSLNATSEYQMRVAGSLPDQKGMGLLPLPGTRHNAPDLAAGSLHGTDIAAGIAAQPVTPNSTLPMQPVQTTHMIPSHVVNNPKVLPGNRPKKRIRTRKGHQWSAAARSEKAAGGHDANEKKGAVEPSKP